MNLVEELKQKRIDSEKESSVIVDSAKLLMAQDVQQERLVLKHLGIDSKITQIEKIQGEEIELKQLKEEYGETFKLSEIRDLALKYGLKLRPSAEYKGEVDLELASKTRRFLQSINEDNDWSIANKFYILAPIESFAMELKPKPAPIPKVMKDPILFYKANPNVEYYTMVHKWGTDFTNTRKLIGWYTKNKKNKEVAALMFIVLFTLLCTVGFALLGASLIVGSLIGFTLSALFCVYLTGTKIYHTNNEVNFNKKHID